MPYVTPYVVTDNNPARTTEPRPGVSLDELELTDRPRRPARLDRTHTDSCRRRHRTPDLIFRFLKFQGSGKAGTRDGPDSAAGTT